MEEQIKLLMSSYSLELLMEENDITEESMVEYLVDSGLVDLEDYFDVE